MFKDELKKFVEDNPKLVNMRSAGEGIFVLKYSRRVFYDNLWNDYLEECRGTIVDADFNVVSRPFTKIYNYGVEAKAPILDKMTKVTAFRKVNGFMVAVTLHNGELLISTTGSTANDYVDYAKEMMETHASLSHWKEAIGKTGSNVTAMFECVHPKDPHIVPEKSGMYLLGLRSNDWDSVVMRDPFFLQITAEVFKCFRAESVTTNMSRLQELVKECKHEGFVAYTDEGLAFKIKSPYYLTAKWVARNPRTDKLLTKEFKELIDEEYYPLLDHIRANIEEYTAMDEQARLAWVRGYLEEV